jgi:hypothetical protein
MLECLHGPVHHKWPQKLESSICQIHLDIALPTKVSLWNKFNSTHYSTSKTISLLTRYGFMWFLCSLNSETPWKEQDMMVWKQVDKLCHFKHLDREVLPALAGKCVHDEGTWRELTYYPCTDSTSIFTASVSGLIEEALSSVIVSQQFFLPISLHKHPKITTRRNKCFIL